MFMTGEKTRGNGVDSTHALTDCAGWKYWRSEEQRKGRKRRVESCAIFHCASPRQPRDSLVYRIYPIIRRA